MALSFRWLGNAGFEIKLDNTILLVDPFLTRPRKSQVYFGRVEVDQKALNAYINECDHILVSHTHFDHFMDVPAIAIRIGAAIHGSANTCALAQQFGVLREQTHPIIAGDEFNLGEIKVKAITARHPWIPGYASGCLRSGLEQPLRLRDYRMDTCLSFLITFKGRHILVWSSTHTDQAERADVLICRAVSDRRWYGEMMEAVQPRLVIPGHWDDMFRPLSESPEPFFAPPRLALPPTQRIDLAEFAEKIIAVRPECAVLVPERFRQYAF